MAEPGVLSQRVGGVEGNRTGRFTRDGIRHDPRLYESEDSIAIRIYLSALTLTFLVVAVMTRGPRRLGSHSSRVPPAIHDSRHQGGATGFKIA